jgi:acylphosphatase
VYFRASAAQRAIALSLRGYAENLADGTVLVMIAGDASALEELTGWLRTGPPMARVDRLQVEAIDPATVEWPGGFEQR